MKERYKREGGGRLRKGIFAVGMVIALLAVVALPVAAKVTAPANPGGKPFQEIWNAAIDLQNQINTVTEVVNNIQLIPGPQGPPGPAGPMPEYRAGSYTTLGYPEETVTFSSPMPDTNYRIALTNTTPGTIITTYGYGNNIAVTSKTTTGFTFTIALFGPGPQGLPSNMKYDYIAIADN